MSNLKKYNLFIFITSFAKLLVELFIPILLYDKGFSIKDIILFLIFKYTFCSIIIPFALKLGNTYNYTKLMIASSIMFSLTYIYLNVLTTHKFSLIFLSLIFSCYLMFYWLGRHIYALAIIEDKKTTDNVSAYSIFTILGGLSATYIGAKILNSFGFITLTVLVLILMLLSVIPLIKIKDVEKKDKIKIKEIIVSFPKRNYIFITIDQLRYIATSIFPLYIYINIKNEITYLGIINIICGIGSIIYIYLLSKKMDKNKKDYLGLSSILLAIVYFLKINTSNTILFLLIIFFEGISKSALDTVVLRNTYAYGKNYEVQSYIGFIELLNNITRTIFLILFYIFNINLKYIILLSVVGMLINAYIKFDDGKYGYNKKNV